jgi:uncharacterized membrane protein YjjP (DUF1212 family)
MDDIRIPHIAAKAGRIILENGGEIYRVEETILRICKAYGVEDCDSFVMPTGIMLSVTYKNGTTSSIVKRIRKRTVNLEKIAQVNALSRALAKEAYPVTALEDSLKSIENLERYGNITTLIAASLGAGFFSLLFGGSFRDFLCTVFIGAVIKTMVNFLDNLSINDFFINIVGGAIAASLSIISTQLGLSTSLDKVVIGAIMLLVPGLAITNGIRDTLAGDLVSGISRAVEAFIIAIGIAVGSGIVYKIWFAIAGGITI